MIFFEKRRRKSSSRKSGRSRRLAIYRSRPVVEWLENRVVLSNYLVTNTNYSGDNSLGAAITAAGDTTAQISFDLPSNLTISLTSSDLSTLTGYGPTAYAISGGATSRSTARHALG